MPDCRKAVAACDVKLLPAVLLDTAERMRDRSPADASEIQPAAVDSIRVETSRVILSSGYGIARSRAAALKFPGIDATGDRDDAMGPVGKIQTYNPIRPPRIRLGHGNRRAFDIR